LVMRSEADWFLDWRTVNTRTAQCRSSHHLCPCPEEVIPHGAPVQEPTVSVREEGVEDVVKGEVVPAHQHAKPATAQVPTDADGGADPRGERECVGGHADGIVGLNECGAGPDPCLGACSIDRAGLSGFGGRRSC
jgi:hypothetical protein